MKVKIIHHASPDSLGDLINEFLVTIEDKEIINIELYISGVDSSDDTYLYALVKYK